jgi:hypothetical protein
MRKLKYVKMFENFNQNLYTGFFEDVDSTGKLDQVQKEVSFKDLVKMSKDEKWQGEMGRTFMDSWLKKNKNTESFTVLRAVGKTHASAQLTLSEVSKHNNIDIIRNREIGHFQGKLSNGKYVLASVIPNKN